MDTRHEVVYGGLGSGKSDYAFGIISPERTFKLGVGGLVREALILKFGSIKRHEQDTQKRGIEFAVTTPTTAARDITAIQHPTMLLDEWTTFFTYSFWWPSQRIIDTANSILDSVEENPHIDRAVYLALDHNPYLPFNLYKKKALWNKVLFERADEITKIDYRKPTRIFPTQNTPSQI